MDCSGVKIERDLGVGGSDIVGVVQFLLRTYSVVNASQKVSVWCCVFSTVLQ